VAAGSLQLIGNTSQGLRAARRRGKNIKNNQGGTEQLGVGIHPSEPQQWTEQNWCIGGYWVTQAGFLGFCVCLKLMLTGMDG
jgi:hypothetical protein